MSRDVIDAHTHAWGPPSRAHPWENERICEELAQYSVHPVYTADRLLADMDRVGVDRAVVVGYPVTEWTDNWYVSECVAGRDRLAGVVMLDHFAPDAVERARETLSTARVVGLRIAPGQPYEHMWGHAPADAVAHPAWLREAVDDAEFWGVVADTDSVVTVSVGPDHLDQVAELVETYPEITYLFDGYGPLDPGGPDAVFEAFAEFAAFENVGVKVSHTPFLSDEGFPYRDVHDLLDWLLETFGRERLAWGSDFPNVTRHPEGVTYEEASEWLDRVEGLSRRDRTYLEGRALRDLLGWPPG